jgi:uncharacterized protein (TIGR00251 family)
MKMTQTPEGTLIKVIVKPRSNSFKVEQEENNLFVHCRSPPEKGKANKELMKELSKLLGHDVFIVSGLTSREKVILVKDAKPDELNSLLLR